MSLSDASHTHLSSSSLPMAWPKGGLASGDDDLRTLAQFGTKLHIGHGQTIFNEGDPAEFAYRLVSGVVRLCKHLTDGRRQIVQFLFPGDFFSFMELSGHSLSAEAVNDVVLIRYPQKHLASLGKEKPSVRERFATLLSLRLHHMHDHLVMLGRQTAKERVASLLLMLFERTGTGEDEIVDIAIPRQDMADYLGLTIETVCRVLSRFKRAQVIDTPNLHQLVLRDIDALKTLARGEK
jgi:CRP-like cAMP-binding protein